MGTGEPVLRVAFSADGRVPQVLQLPDGVGQVGVSQGGSSGRVLVQTLFRPKSSCPPENHHSSEKNRVGETFTAQGRQGVRRDGVDH